MIAHLIELSTEVQTSTEHFMRAEWLVEHWRNMNLFYILEVQEGRCTVATHIPATPTQWSHKICHTGPPSAPTETETDQ